MKTILLATILCFSTILCLGQTQRDMDDSAFANYNTVDKELNSVYQHILKEYHDDTAFIRNFKIAQRLWIQFRDAEVKAKYPDRPDGYGSVQPMCWAIYITGLTQERINELKEWTDGIEEGDVCIGSVKMKRAK